MAIQKISKLPAIVGSLANNDLVAVADVSSSTTVKVTISQLLSGVSGFLSSTLSSGKVFVGNGSNVATERTLSGDMSIDNTGVSTIGNNVISNAKFRQSTGLSLVGRYVNSTGNVADISTTNGSNEVLMETGSNLAFGKITNNNISASAGIVYSKLSLANGIVNADVNTSAAIALTKLGNTSFTKTVGTIASGNSINTALSKALSSDGDAFGADINIGLTDDNTVNLIQNGDSIIKFLQNSGAYNPKYVMIGDRATSSTDFNICTLIGTTSQQSSSGIGKGTVFVDRVTISQDDTNVYAIDQLTTVYNPSSYSTSGSAFVGLRLGYDQTNSKDWQLCITRDTGWLASDAGDIYVPVGFSDTPSSYVGGNGIDTINYVLGDPSNWFRIRVEEVGGTVEDRFIPLYALTQIPNTP